MSAFTGHPRGAQGAATADRTNGQGPAGSAQPTQLEVNPRRVVNPLGVGMLVIAALLLVSVIELWPLVEQPVTTTTGQTPPASAAKAVKMIFGLFTLRLDREQALILLVLLISATGSFVHIATSFSSFVGNRQYYARWTWWYVLRVVVGTALALILYFAIRGGFMSANASGSDVNAYGIAAIAGLTGLFSKQATDKLREVFETLFKVSGDAGDAQRKDGLDNPKPILSRIEPATALVGTQSPTISLHGTGFSSASIVRVGGKDQQTHFVNSTALSATLSSDHVSTPGDLDVTVFTPEPGGGVSQPLPFHVVAAPSPEPAVTSVDPAEIDAGAAPGSITVRGTGFTSSSTIVVDGVDVATGYVSNTALTFTPDAGKLAQPGTIQVSVVTPPPGGGTSGALALTVRAPVVE